MDKITAKEFFTNTFELSFLTEEERETIFTGAELYAKGKCREQRKYCADEVANILTETKRRVLNAKEPEFDLPSSIPAIP